MGEIFLSANHKVEVYEYCKKTETLSFCVDDKHDGSVTGDFYIDRNNRLHHNILFDDGEEIEVIINI